MSMVVVVGVDYRCCCVRKVCSDMVLEGIMARDLYSRQRSTLFADE
jgi:hypothetical protein